MLRHHGFVEQDAGTREYRSGPALVDLGLTAIRNLDLRRETRPYLERLGSELEETVHLLVLRGAESIFLDVFEPPTRALRSTSRLGVTLPAYATSGGKALLAQLSTEELHALLPDEELPSLTDRTITLRSDLEAELEQIRERGYAVNLGESEPEIGGVAVALRDRLGEYRGALTVTAPLTRLNDETASEIGRSVAEAARAWEQNVPSALHA
jgi:DNA-binding IclR family transcriptional regulator